jgi:hypothetical protein
MNFRLKVYFAKDVTILHLKSSGSCRLSYFLTSTLLEHTSDDHGPPIADDRFLNIEKYGQPATTGSWLVFDMERF